MRSPRIAVLILASVASLLAQTTSSSSNGTLNISPGLSQGITFDSSSTILNPPPSNMTWLWSAGGGRIFTALPAAETRKPKSPLMTIAMVRSGAHTLTQDELAPAAYLKLAKSVGLESAATDEARVLSAIAELNLPVYNFERVDEYLYEQALKHGAKVRWVWKPMRDTDAKAVADVSWVESKSGFIYGAQYQNKIPENVIERVALVLTKLPDAAFLVSDYEVVKPDPFLAVTTKKLAAEGKVWIIAQWDNPGFVDPGAATIRMGIDRTRSIE